MKILATVCIVILSAWMLRATSASVDQNKDDARCAVIERALRDYQQIRSSNTRREVEKYFRRDGGLQFPAKSRYVLPECDYIHVDIEFDLVKPEQISFKPEDKVISISKLYLEYPARD